MNPFGQSASSGPGAQSILASVLDANPNRAPIWVFVVLGLVIGVVALAMYLASYTGSQHDYLYADPSNNYFGSPGGGWGAGGFGGFGGFTHL